MIKVQNLCKSYTNFALKDVSFELQKGYIMGFIGQNGAGKTTTIKSMLNLAFRDSGKITIFGKDIDGNETAIKQDLGLSLGNADYYPRMRVGKIANVVRGFFDNWEESKYQELLKRFALDENKRIMELSKGMKTKLSIAFALSHNAKLLILDEPTSGLDPIAREDLLDLFSELVSDGTRSIIFSTHITSDLDKCADYVLFIHNGKIVAFDEKDDLVLSHAVVRGSLEEMQNIDKSKLIGIKQHKFGFTALTKKQHTQELGLQHSIPNLEEIMVHYGKEG